MNAAAPTEWVCAKCGSAGGHPLPGFTQIDSRYTTGYCDICTVAEPMKPRRGPRPTSELVVAECFNRAEFIEKQEKGQLQKLVHKFANGKANVNMTEREVYLLVSLYDKWGAPGFFLPQKLREVAAAYAVANQPKDPSRGKRTAA